MRVLRDRGGVAGRSAAKPEAPTASTFRFKARSDWAVSTRLIRRTTSMLSGWLIFLAMIFDALDGHVARLARTSSEFGAELDSLCDVVSFGVAPGFLLVKMCPSLTYWHPEAIWIIAAAVPVCAALRLARFNVETAENEDHLQFSGLPSPAAAGSIAGFAILFYTLRQETNSVANIQQIDSIMEIWVCILALAVAALMVSRIPYPHVVNQLFRGQRSFGHIVGAGVHARARSW